MFSVAALLDRAKAKAGIESDYRLAKVIGISHQGMTNYRTGKSMPDARVLQQLCALSGDDLDVIGAQVQAERERTAEGRALWLRVAARLQAGAATALSAIFAVLIAIAFVAGTPGAARAFDGSPQSERLLTNLYIVSSAFDAVMQRWRQITGFCRLLFFAPL